MMNRWGNDDHGPGGDPSWLGGEDRSRSGGGDSEGTWSSDVGPDAGADFGAGAGHRRPDSDFGGGPAASVGQGSRAEDFAPVFGRSAGEGPLPSGGDEDSPWKSAFTGADAEESGSRVSGLPKVLRTGLRLVIPVIFFIVFLRIFTAGGFGHGSSMSGGFFKWWMLLFVAIPLINIVRGMFRGGR